MPTRSHVRSSEIHHRHFPSCNNNNDNDYDNNMMLRERPSM